MAEAHNVAQKAVSLDRDKALSICSPASCTWKSNSSIQEIIGTKRCGDFEKNICVDFEKWLHC